jgi:hypothetical protein
LEETEIKARRKFKNTDSTYSSEMQTAGEKQARKQTKKQEDQKSEEQARIPRNLATSITIPAPKVRAKNERDRKNSQSRHNSRYSQELLLFFFFPPMLHTGKKRYRLFLSPKKREQRCDYTRTAGTHRCFF